MPSRKKLRAALFRTPSHCVVRFGAASKSSKENVPGSDFTSQYRRSPFARGANVEAHLPWSYGSDWGAFFAADFVSGFAGRDFVAFFAAAFAAGALFAFD